MEMATWKGYMLGAVCKKIGSGATPRGGGDTYQDSGEFALIRSQNVLDFEFSKSGLAYINSEQAEKLKNVEVEDRDVLLNITGDSVARVCQVPKNILPARVNQHVAILRPDKEVLNPEFLKYYLLNPKFKEYLLMLASSGATRNALTKSMIEDFQIDAPDLPTQIAIAEILSSLDDKIELNNQINQELEALAQALFKHWFIDFEFPISKEEAAAMGNPKLEGKPYKSSGGKMVESELGEIPNGWKSGVLSDVIDFNPSERLSHGDVAQYLDMSSLPTESSWPMRPIPRAFGSGMKFRNGDTLFARITPCLENGKTAFVQCLDDNEIAWGSTEFVVMRPKEPWPKEIGYIIAREKNFREFAIQNMVGTSGRQRVQSSLLESYPFSYPKNALLINSYANTVVPLFEVIKNNAQENENLASLRDALLPRLISGELKITK